MTLDSFNSTYADADFGANAYGRFGEAWRWRVAGLAIMAVSVVFTTALYWKLALFLISTS
jgi:hypothetical protein